MSFAQVGIRALTGCLMSGLLACAARADSSNEIAKQAQNPIASLISVPFQNNTTFGVGEHSAVADLLEIEPVIPVALSPDWSLITRTILPIIEQPALGPGVGSVSGLGDVQPSFYFSPARPTHGVIWGLGPSFAFPTASDRPGIGLSATWRLASRWRL